MPPETRSCCYDSGCGICVYGHPRCCRRQRRRRDTTGVLWLLLTSVTFLMHAWWRGQLRTPSPISFHDNTTTTAKATAAGANVSMIDNTTGTIKRIRVTPISLARVNSYAAARSNTVQQAGAIDILRQQQEHHVLDDHSTDIDWLIDALVVDDLAFNSRDCQPKEWILRRLHRAAQQPHNRNACLSESLLDLLPSELYSIRSSANAANLSSLSSFSHRRQPSSSLSNRMRSAAAAVGLHRPTYGITTCQFRDLCADLPTWDELVALYGPAQHEQHQPASSTTTVSTMTSHPAAGMSGDVLRERQRQESQPPKPLEKKQQHNSSVVVIGLETCASYRQTMYRMQMQRQLDIHNTTIPYYIRMRWQQNHPIVPQLRIAGLYNSGTTALAHLLTDHPAVPRSARRGGHVASAGFAPVVATQPNQAMNNNDTATTGSGSGTTLSENNHHNMYDAPDYTGWEVPWGKHVPAPYRGENWFPPGLQQQKQQLDALLSLVVVREPFAWMKSMCKASYDATWEARSPLARHARGGGSSGETYRHSCPYLQPQQDEQNASSIIQKGERNHRSTGTSHPTIPGAKFKATSNATITVRTHQTRYQHTDVYPSLPEMWKQWHDQYLHATFPRLILRFEDILFHSDEVMDAISTCVGGWARWGVVQAPSSQKQSATKGQEIVHGNSMYNPIYNRLAESKTHGHSANWPTAMIQAGSAAARWDFAKQHFSMKELQYAQSVLQEWMKQLHYAPLL